jgi:hypothetical protein
MPDMLIMRPKDGRSDVKSAFSHDPDSYAARPPADEYEKLLRGEISSAEYAQAIDERLERAAEEHPLTRSSVGE